MNRFCLSIFTIALGVISTPALSQTDSLTTVADTTLLGLPGDNLDLYVVLDIFQKSKTIEEFEKSLNSSDTKVNNLDLNLDEKVDFIKVSGTKKDEDFTFVLKVDVTKDETQDVAVILVSRDKNKKVTVQIVGDKDLYGKDYIVDLKEFKKEGSTPNPGYTGDDPAPAAPASGTTTTSTTTVIVEQVPIVQYVYSPMYVPYVPPYYYGYYPPYFFAASCIAVGIYRSNHYYNHYHGGYGYHGNTVVVHNHNSYNNYNNYNRNTSNTVNHNKANGNYDRGNNASTRPATGGSGGARPSTQPAGGSRPSAGTQPSTRPSTGNQGGAKPSTQPSTRPSTGNQGGTRPSTQPSTRPSTGNQSGARPSTQPSSRPSNSYSGASRPSSQPSRSSGSYSGGGRSMGGGGYSGGGGSRGGGGGGGGRRR